MKIIFSLLLTLLSLNSYAASSVWEISKGDNKLYIGGTVHMLAESDYPLPSAFESAYQQTSTLIMEVDAASLALPENQIKMLKLMTYDDGRSLESELSPETYAQILQYFSERSMPKETIQNLSVVGTSLTITLLEYQIMGMKQEYGVEAYFIKKLQGDKKSINYLETAGEQIGFLSSLQLVPSDDLLKQTIDEVKNMPAMIQDLKQAWRSGNLSKMEEVGIKPIMAEYPEVYEALLKERNNKWLKKIDSMLQDEEVEFILVGGLHLAGKDGLINQLKNKGYTLKQVD